MSGVEQLKETYHLPPTKSLAHIAIDLDLFHEACHCFTLKY